MTKQNQSYGCQACNLKWISQDIGVRYCPYCGTYKTPKIIDNPPIIKMRLVEKTKRDWYLIGIARMTRMLGELIIMLGIMRDDLKGDN